MISVYRSLIGGEGTRVSQFDFISPAGSGRLGVMLMVLKSLASSIWWGFHICETTQQMCIRPVVQALERRSWRRGWVGSLYGRGPTGSAQFQGIFWLDHPTAFSSPALLWHAFHTSCIRGIFLSYFCIPMSQWTFSDIKDF